MSIKKNLRDIFCPLWNAGGSVFSSPRTDAKRAQATAAAGHALSLQQAIYFRKTCFIQNASGSRISLRISAPSVSRKQTRSPFTASAAAMPAASPIERQIG